MYGTETRQNPLHLFHRYLALRAEMQIIFWGQCSQYKGKIGITAIAILAIKGTAAKKHRNDR